MAWVVVYKKGVVCLWRVVMMAVCVYVAGCVSVLVFLCVSYCAAKLRWSLATVSLSMFVSYLASYLDRHIYVNMLSRLKQACLNGLVAAIGNGISFACLRLLLKTDANKKIKVSIPGTRSTCHMNLKKQIELSIPDNSSPPDGLRGCSKAKLAVLHVGSRSVYQESDFKDLNLCDLLTYGIGDRTNGSEMWTTFWETLWKKKQMEQAWKNDSPAVYVCGWEQTQGCVVGSEQLDPIIYVIDADGVDDTVVKMFELTVRIIDNLPRKEEYIRRLNGGQCHTVEFQRWVYGFFGKNRHKWKCSDNSEMTVKYAPRNIRWSGKTNSGDLPHKGQ
eukprot:GHVQ01013057.1.p1 GENE.GHVQ01013057.1~~GHVQ01013057.1.p1  ORF type:complete len:331 (+),score=35.98 GHVQ01013057.1:211-1203(+)